MKKKTIKILVACISVLLIVAVVIRSGVLTTLLYTKMIGISITHSDIKKIDLSELNKIVVRHNGEEYEFTPEESDFETISKIFDNKKVKVDVSKVRFWSEGEYEIEFITGDRNYILYGAPEILVDTEKSNLQNPVCFVLYDYSKSETNEFIFQIVKISKKDFVEIFGKIIQDGGFVLSSDWDNTGRCPVFSDIR